MIKDKVLRFLSREQIESFFMGPIYPLIVAALVLGGYFFAWEYYLHFINMALVCVALCTCRSIRPVIIVLCSFVFQISREHTPATNNVTGVPSDYYFTDGRPIWILVSFALVAAAFTYFYVKNKLITLSSLKALPLLLPTAALTVAFLLGGVFSSVWSERSLYFSLIQIVVWFVVFYLFVLGFKHEKGGELLDYLVYVASVIAAILLLQLLEIFVSGADGMLDEEGNFIRGSIVYGWGVTNNAAQSLTVLIPILFIGILRSKHSVYYFVMATLAFVGSILNLSRTALVVGVPIYVAAIIIALVKSKRKKLLAIEIAITLVSVAALIIAFREYTFPAFGNYLIRGMGDSGRFGIWEGGIRAFLDAPIFGMGFFGLEKVVPGFSNTTFIPFMMHNTPIHMLACFGIVGAAAYSYYRIMTIIPFVKRPSTAKTLIGLSLLSVLLGSLLENFIFYILPMFTYSAIFAVFYKLVEEEGEEKLSADSTVHPQTEEAASEGNIAHKIEDACAADDSSNSNG